MTGPHIKFTPNIPVIVCLVDAEADSSQFYDFELQIGRYQTTDGRVLALPRPAVIKLNSLGILPGEEIGICEHVDGKMTEWLIWLTPKTEQERARRDAENPPELADQLTASIAQAEAKKRIGPPILLSKKPPRKAKAANPHQTRLFDRRGTGTHGPEPLENPVAPLIPAASAPTRTGKPEVIPWNVAFREVSAWVAEELAANKLQWSDESQKSMCCTVLIAEVKAGRIGPWERNK